MTLVCLEVGAVKQFSHVEVKFALWISNTFFNVLHWAPQNASMVQLYCDHFIEQARSLQKLDLPFTEQRSNVKASNNKNNEKSGDFTIRRRRCVPSNGKKNNRRSAEKREMKIGKKIDKKIDFNPAWTPLDFAKFSPLCQSPQYRQDLFPHVDILWRNLFTARKMFFFSLLKFVQRKYFS